ncbi:YrdC domain-containing protein mitochondrial [Taenia crassiceps]|uniref:Threonylcarbamoyl-AMP synthase n=1 Tax=Taenia crassiceps TaxID=6207 RepID=A0ABR4QAY5_9CEST
MCGLARSSKVVTLAKADHLLPEIAHILLSGGVVAVPTDTLYGLACCSLSTRGIDRIYQIKGRDGAKPMAICLDKAASLSQWSNTGGIEGKLLSSLLPGPVTVLLPRLIDDPLNPLLNPRVMDIGIRVPDSSFVCRLSEVLANVLRTMEVTSDDLHITSRCFSASAIPLVLTSANPSGQKSTLSPNEFSDLWPQLDLVVDGGRIGGDSDELQISRAGSTVVDLSPAVRSQGQKLQYRILRDGSALNQTKETLHQFGFTRKLDP